MKNKIFVFLLTVTFLVPMFSFPEVASAKTLYEFKLEVNKTLEDLKKNQEELKLTDEQIAQIKKNIENKRAEINAKNEEMVKLTEQITQLEKDIDAKNEEIKKVMNFVQVSNGESSYLEYIFGAADFTDFIYRTAIAEQLSKHNNTLIKKFNKMIEENNAQKVDLENKKNELKKQQSELEEESKKLEFQKIEIMDNGLSLEDTLKMQLEYLAILAEKGCKDNEDITTCGRNILPTTTKLYRPIVRGRRTCEFGSSCYNFHYGLDIADSSEEDVPVYASGTGLVIGIIYRGSCGGNMIFIQHRFKDGSTYTTSYQHLRRVDVSKGQTVTRDTQIGIMGGDPNKEYWDSCSTGKHLHFVTANGLYLTDYYSWSTFEAKSFNPRLIVNFPTGNGYFSDRITEY